MNGRLVRRALLWVGAVACVLWSVTWLVGAPSTLRALGDLDQQRLDALFSKVATSQSPPRIERFVVEYGMALPAVWYYEGQSRTSAGAVSDHVHRSLVLWYGVGSSVVWQDKEWLPGSAAKMRHLAEAGH